MTDPKLVEAVQEELRLFISGKTCRKEAAERIIPLIRAAALEEAAKECERHAEFCKEEAHKGGNYDHLMTRYHEANHNALCIRSLIPAQKQEG